MSLINRMLQDLEKRRASGAERVALPRHVRVLPRANHSRTPLWLLGLAVAMALISAITWYITTQRMQRDPAAIAAALIPALPQPAGSPYASAPASEETPAIVTVAVAHPEPPARASGDARGATPAARPIPISAVVARDSSPPRSASTPATEAESVKQTRSAPASGETTRPPLPALAMPSAKPTGATPRPSESADESNAQAAPVNAQIDKRTRELTPQQLAEIEYREGANLLNQGRPAQAQEKFRLALAHYPGHIGARQGAFGLLLDARKTGEAEQLLKEALEVNAHQPGFAMALARMQVDRGDTASALETLQRTAAAASGSPDYLAFLAALLQRQTRHLEAVEHYQAALSLAPGSGVWLMGLGISLQALNRRAEARDAFHRAQATRALNPELHAFVDQRLKQLQ